jgi:photosystem II stability/assembly factor-like uncharacterized protein
MVCRTGLLRTDDRGLTWIPVPAPRVTSGGDGGATLAGVRFANTRDGYLFGKGLLSTHDGGLHWTRVPLNGCTWIDALEIGTGVVHVVARCRRGYTLFTGPYARDAFVPTRVPLSSTPISGIQLVVSRTRAWIAATYQGLVVAARYEHGLWGRWPTAPCRTPMGNGYPSLNVDPSTGALVADCYQYAGPPTVTPVASTNGGATFHRVGPDLVAEARVATLDAASGADVEPRDIEFTNASQAFAIVDLARTNSTAMFLTTDAGRTWRRIAFP